MGVEKEAYSRIFFNLPAESGKYHWLRSWKDIQTSLGKQMEGIVQWKCPGRLWVLERKGETEIVWNV